MLRRKKLVLLDPVKWEDKNDAEIILEYKKKRKIQSLFAVCFGIGDETIHHWKTYSSGISGCCIEFDENRLLASLAGISEVRWGEVEYKKLREVQDGPIAIDRIPFTKRWPYRCESEFRVLWEGQTYQESMDLGINLSSINKITISQNMPQDIFNTIAELLRDVTTNPNKKINRSTLYENKKWIRAFKQ